MAFPSAARADPGLAPSGPAASSAANRPINASRKTPRVIGHYGDAVTLEKRVRPHELVEGEFLDGTPTDPLGRVAQSFARNLREAMGDQSGRAFERASGMSNASVVRILKGQVWPDAVTIARLEVATRRSLWPTYESAEAD